MSARTSFLLCIVKQGTAWIQSGYTTSLVPFQKSVWFGETVHLSCIRNNPAHYKHCSVPFFSFSVMLFSSGRTCPWPLPPSENSEVRLLHPTSTFDALLEVRCKPGFTLPNGLDATMRRCQGDKQWSGDVPVCTGVFKSTKSFGSPITGYEHVSISN